MIAGNSHYMYPTKTHIRVNVTNSLGTTKDIAEKYTLHIKTCAI